MNTSIIRYILGQAIRMEGLLLLLPCIISLIYQEKAGLAYLIVAVICVAIGSALTFVKPKNKIFYLKEGCVITSLTWISLSIFGCLPFIISGDIPSFTDALFETVSGFTTTGASILSDVEALSYASLFWRSFTHWVGGMGVLVFILAIVPLSGGSNMNLMKAESPGPSVGKLVPKLKQTARLLYFIYLGLTIIQFILLLIGKMPVFDAITLTLGTAGTGGFAVRNTGLTEYTAYQQWVITIFMIVFGVNFNAYYFIILKKFKKAFTMEEVRAYLLIVIAASAIIFVEIYEKATGIEYALRHAFFQVAAIITTTGYSTIDFDLWSTTAKTVIILLMFSGACAGSTAGGIKISRIIVAIKTMLKEMNSYIHPKSIKKINIEGKPIEHEILRSINVFLITYMLIFGASMLLISTNKLDMTTNFTSVLTSLSNVGPGFNLVGPTKNFGFLNSFTKYILIFDMLAGRLELFPLLMLFHPGLWKGFFSKKKDF